MRVVACYSVLNEGEFLPYSLKSVLPFVDKVVIVEGAYQCHVDNNQGQTHSIDDTWEVAQRFCDHPKVTAFQASEPDQMRQRDLYLDRLEDGDIYLLIDGDELYRGQDIQFIKDAFAEDPELTWIRLKLVTFIHDLKHHWPRCPAYRRVGRVSAYRYSTSWRHCTRKYNAVHLFRNNGAGPNVVTSTKGISPEPDECCTFHTKLLKDVHLLAIRNAYYARRQGSKEPTEDLVRRFVENWGRKKRQSVLYEQPIPFPLKKHPLYKT